MERSGDVAVVLAVTVVVIVVVVVAGTAVAMTSDGRLQSGA